MTRDDTAKATNEGEKKMTIRQRAQRRTKPSSGKTDVKANPIKVLIVDDHPSVREGLGMWIAAQPDMEVCGEAADAAPAVKLVEELRPDVVIIDIQLESGNGLDLVQRIKAWDDSIAILICSMYSDAIYAQRAINAGASGYINKRIATSRIVEAIRRVRDGNIFLCENTANYLLRQTIGRGSAQGQAEWRAYQTASWRFFASSAKGRPLLKSPGVFTAARVRWNPTVRKSRLSLP